MISSQFNELLDEVSWFASKKSNFDDLSTADSKLIARHYMLALDDDEFNEFISNCRYSDEIMGAMKTVLRERDEESKILLSDMLDTAALDYFHEPLHEIFDKKRQDWRESDEYDK